MSMPSERQAIWDVACSCALTRIKKCCNNEFGSIECNDCKVYVYNYIDAEPRKVNLLMLQAESTARSLVNLNRDGTRGIILFITIPILLFALGVWFLNSKWSNGPLPGSSTAKDTVKIEQPVIENAEQAIWTTLKKVSADMKKKKDVNNDGLVNCIDAAIMFYRYYPYKDKVLIYWNYNPSKDFNHLFNLVLVNGTWIGVEPQAVFCGYTNTYRMHDIWKGQYDSSRNQNSTDSWLQYLN